MTCDCRNGGGEREEREQKMGGRREAKKKGLREGEKE